MQVGIAYCSGTTSMNVLPRPYSLVNEMLPPSTAANFSLRCRPRPVPSRPFLFETAHDQPDAAAFGELDRVIGEFDENLAQRAPIGVQNERFFRTLTGKARPLSSACGRSDAATSSSTA